MLFLSVITDCTPGHIQARSQCGIGDDAPVPDGGDEIVLADDSLSVANQVFEKIKHLGCNRYEACPATQLAAVSVQHAVLEEITQASVPRAASDVEGAL
jgi:hypothetical protein